MHGVGVSVSGFNHTFIASTAWKASRSDGDGGDSRQRDCVGIIGTDASLSGQSAAIKVQWCVSPINVLSTGCQASFSYLHLLSISFQGKCPHPGGIHIYLLGFVSLSNAIAGHLPFLQHPRAVQKPPAGSTKLDPTTLPETEPARAEQRTLRAMLNGD
jgi:hypothetical protein